MAMENEHSREDALLRNMEQVNALIDYVRLAGLNALNDYHKDKLLNLTTRQGLILTTVARLLRQQGGNGITLSCLAREMRMSVSATSHLADTLEEHNLLTRRADDEDRRSVRICLSTMGKKCAALAKQGMLKAINKLTSQLSPEENERRINMIERIYRLAYPERA